MKYPLIKDAIETTKGKQLYSILSKGMDRGLELTTKSIKDAIQKMPCYLGSEDHIARMVWMLMNEEE